MITFRQYSIMNHDGREPNEAYLKDQTQVIGEFFVEGISALDSRASDETCSYCLMIEANSDRGA